jgi:hypothetical protein
MAQLVSAAAAGGPDWTPQVRAFGTLFRRWYSYPFAVLEADTELLHLTIRPRTLSSLIDLWIGRGDVHRICRTSLIALPPRRPGIRIMGKDPDTIAVFATGKEAQLLNELRDLGWPIEFR